MSVGAVAVVFDFAPFTVRIICSVTDFRYYSFPDKRFVIRGNFFYFSKNFVSLNTFVFHISLCYFVIYISNSGECDADKGFSLLRHRFWVVFIQFQTVIKNNSFHSLYLSFSFNFTAKILWIFNLGFRCKKVVTILR